jgi:hypothetical protein
LTAAQRASCALSGSVCAAAERQEVQRLAAGMEVEHDIGERQRAALEIVGDLLGDRAVRPAGKAAVQVALVDRRGARAGPEGRIVHAGTMITAPETSSASACGPARTAPIGPSYSSP